MNNYDNRHLFNRHFLYGVLFLALVVLSNNAFADWIYQGATCTSVRTTGADNPPSVSDYGVPGCDTNDYSWLEQRYGSYRLKYVVSATPQYLWGETYAWPLNVYYSVSNDECPANQVLDGNHCVPQAPVTCSSPELIKEIEVSQYACETNNPNTQMYDTNFSWSCTDMVGAEVPNFKTSCVYEPNNCVVGISCDDKSDTPVCNPESQDCPVPAPVPDDEIKPDPNVPPENPEFCDLYPELCGGQPAPQPTPEPSPSPDTPKPDNPDLSVGDNAITKEQSITNNHLRNINHNVQQYGTITANALSRNNQYQLHQLGQLKEINKQLKKQDGSESRQVSELVKTNQKLDKISCLLDENCEGNGQEKPSAKADCAAQIFECKGDVVQCLIAKQNYENTCLTDDLDELKKSFDAFPAVNPEEMLVDTENSVDFSKMDTKYLDNGVSFGTRTCPAPVHMSLDIPYIGSYTIEFSYEPACQWAAIMNPLVHIAGWIFGLFIIFRANGAG